MTSSCPAARCCPACTGLKGPLSCLSEARFGILWGVTGAARACFETAAEYARTREQFGRKIGGFQLTQRKLAWMLADLQRAQLLALHIGRLKEAGHAHAGADQPRQDEQRPHRHRHRPRRPGPSSAPTASRWSTRSSGTPTTWNRCSPTKAPRRSTPSPSARPSPASRPIDDRRA